MASDLQHQLSLLRQRLASIDRKYSDVRSANPPKITKPGIVGLPGLEVETALGHHWEMERLYEKHKRHGSVDISDLAELPSDLFQAISERAVCDAPPETWVFLDTETTGLAGGSGTIAFLIGVGRITREGFRVKQFFLREHGEEASALDALTQYLRGFQVMVTYNGRAYDQPLLETRYRMSRAKPPFAHLEHVDLLHSARALWKLHLESCRLVELENQILGVERQGDLPGELIPYIYFEYLRKRELERLIPIFHHNAMDILTLACLCGIVPRAFRSPWEAPVRHGGELAGLGRWWRRMNEPEGAVQLLRAAVDKGLPDELMFQTLWDIAKLEKKLGRQAAALPILTDLAASRNLFRLAALEELAKYYEHRVRDFSMALEITLSALEISRTPASGPELNDDARPAPCGLERRKARLEQRLSSLKSGPLGL